MRKKSISLLSIILVFGLLLANILYVKTPVQAAGDSSVEETNIYKWYQAKSLTDLKQYTDKGLGQTWSYEGTWIPIIIVPEYPDGTECYWNRDYKLNNLSTSDTVGATLLHAMQKGGEFYTKGDLHALHMFYHGSCTSTYSNRSITAEAWSLTNDSNIKDPDFGKKTNDAPSTAYGIENGGIAGISWRIAWEKVLKWNEGKGLPETTSSQYAGTRQAWSFIPYNNEGTFLISNMFESEVPVSGTNSFEHDGTVQIMKIGKVWKQFSSTSMYLYPEKESLSYNERDWQGEEINKRIVEKYKKKKNWCSFKIFVGQKLGGNQKMAQTNTTLNGTKIVGLGNELPNGVTLTVNKDAVLIVPADSFFYLNGFIKNYGTIVIGADSTVTSIESRSSPTTLRGISCMDGGTLIIEEKAKVYLEKLLVDGGTVVCNGAIVLQDMLSMENAQIQIESEGTMLCGAQLGIPDNLRIVNADSDTWFKSIQKSACNFKLEIKDKISSITLEKVIWKEAATPQEGLAFTANLIDYSVKPKGDFKSLLKSQDFTGKTNTIKEQGYTYKDKSVSITNKSLGYIIYEAES